MVDWGVTLCSLLLPLHFTAKPVLKISRSLPAFRRDGTPGTSCISTEESEQSSTAFIYNSYFKEIGPGSSTDSWSQPGCELVPTTKNQTAMEAFQKIVSQSDLH